jgi:hypothetical protein
MIPYFYQARFTAGLIMHVIENASSFEDAMRASVEVFGGKVIKCALIASSSEPAGFLEFPDDVSARAWNVFLPFPRWCEIVHAESPAHRGKSKGRKSHTRHLLRCRAVT